MTPQTRLAILRSNTGSSAVSQMNMAQAPQAMPPENMPMPPEPKPKAKRKPKRRK